MPTFWLATAVVTTIVLRLPFYRLPMISDEGGYAYAAERWRDGRGKLYDDIWISRPQGIFVAYHAIFRTLGTDAVALRIGATLAAIGTLLIVWRFAASWAGPKVAACAAMLFAVLSASPAIEGFTANAEVFMALPAAAAALLLLRAARTRWRASWLIAAGLMTGVAILLKPSALTMIPMGVAFAWLMSPRDHRLAAGRSAWFGLGCALAIAPALVHGYLVGWDNFVFAAITYRVAYQSSASNSLYHHAAGLLIMFSRAWPVLVLPLVPSAVTLWSRRGRLPVQLWAGRLAEASRLGIVAWSPRVAPAPRAWADVAERFGDAGLLLRLWLLAAVAGIAMGGDWWVHYLVQIIAPLSIWLATALLRVHRGLASDPRAQRLLVATVAVLALLPYGVIAKGSDAAMSVAIFHHGGYADQQAVADYLRANSAPETPIFAGFNEAALYYLADRPAAYRYLFDQELLAFPDSEQRLIAMVEGENRPRYIIGTKQRAPFADNGRAFWAAVRSNYSLEAIVHGVPIFRANSPFPHHLVPE